jgi:hypothetical protein
VQKVFGTSNAARVSRGSQFDLWKGVANREPKRDKTQEVCVTVSIYYTVTGGVPTAEDVRAAIDDLDGLYKSCSVDEHLADRVH